MRESAAPSRQLAVIGRLALAILALGFLVYTGWLVAAPGGHSARDLWLYTALEVVALGLLLYRLARVPSDRWPWGLLALALAIWIFADVWYTVTFSRQEAVPFPALSDWAYLLFYVLTYAFLVALLFQRAPRPGLRVWLDGLTIALGAGAFAWLAVPAVQERLSGSTPEAMFMSLANPVSDILLLCLLIGILGVIGWRADPRWWFLVAAVGLLWTVDILYLLSVLDEEYAVGSILDAGWVAVFLLLALASWQRRDVGPLPEPGRRAQLLPTVVGGLSLGLLIYATAQRVPVASVVLASAALMMAAWRAQLAFRASAVDAEARRQARTDDLTGAGNRRFLRQQLSFALHDRRANQQCAVLVIDVDSFKEINDALGHQAGDDVLRHAARCIAKDLREADSVARIGGDEFAVVLGPGVTVDSAVAVADHIRSAVSVPISIADLALEVEVSIGIAICPDHADSVETALRAADMAMYQAKRARVGIAVYDRTLDRPDRGRVLRRQELRRALASHELICEYQPIVDLGTGLVTRVEALSRWLHPELGLLYPGAFLATAEQTGLMTQVTARVLDTALSQAASWANEDLWLTVSVNLSMDDVRDPDLSNNVRDALNRYSLPGSALNLEVTETALVADGTLQAETFSAIRELGVAISVDDYGKGYSSLDQLLTLSADELKLDKSFVTGLAEDAGMQAIVKTTVSLARDLGIGLVAEGVESAQDLAALQGLGCEAVQGFYVCRPQSAEALTYWLKSRSGHQIPAGAPVWAADDE